MATGQYGSGLFGIRLIFGTVCFGDSTCTTCAVMCSNMSYETEKIGLG